MQSKRVLVVDDEPMVRDVVARYLERDGYSVDLAATGDEALAKLAGFRPDLVVLDIMLPGPNGLELLGSIRAEGDLPVIMLTARADETDRVIGLELGADDYVVKPFSPRELTARVRSVLRRADGLSRPDAGVLEFGELHIDLGSREVKVDGVSAHLTVKEFDLLAFLASAPRQVFSRAQILRHVWESSPEWQDPSTVTVHIRRIRNKIEADPVAPRYVVTVRGVGYRFEP